MDDPPRPGPIPTIAERALEHLSFVGPGRLASAALSMLLVAAGCWWLLRAPAPPVERDLPFTAGASAAAGSPGTSAVPTTDGAAPGVPGQAATIIVQAAGAVVAPGVYTMPSGARVHELVAAAGGVTPDADPSAIALAVVLRDGERVYVPRLGEVPPTASAVAASAATAGVVAVGPVDLNRATAADLDALPGIGPATASAIVEHRERNGPFASVDDLLDVPGIGPAKLEGLRDLVTT